MTGSFVRLFPVHSMIGRNGCGASLRVGAAAPHRKERSDSHIPDSFGNDPPYRHLALAGYALAWAFPLGPYLYEVAGVSDYLCSVVVATYNRSRLLLRLLDSLKAQDLDFDRFEVIVVDDGSTDDTEYVLHNLVVPFSMSVQKQNNQGPAAARNAAIKVACSNLIVSLDDDVIATPGLLNQHVNAHSGRPHLAAMGTMELPHGRKLNPWLEWEALALSKQYDAMRRGNWSASPRQFYTANASFTRCDALAAGLFDPRFRRAEDVEFAYRLQDRGGTFAFLPDAVVHHEPNRSYQEWVNVPAQYGHYDVMMSREKGREDVLSLAAREFNYRRRPLQLVARLLVGRKPLLKTSLACAGWVARIAGWLAMKSMSMAAYSVVFNLQYWQGLSDSLGGRSEFWRVMEQA